MLSETMTASAAEATEENKLNSEVTRQETEVCTVDRAFDSASVSEVSIFQSDGDDDPQLPQSQILKDTYKQDRRQSRLSSPLARSVENQLAKTENATKPPTETKRETKTETTTASPTVRKSESKKCIRKWVSVDLRDCLWMNILTNKKSYNLYFTLDENSYSQTAINFLNQIRVSNIQSKLLVSRMVQAKQKYISLIPTSTHSHEKVNNININNNNNINNNIDNNNNNKFGLSVQDGWQLCIDNDSFWKRSINLFDLEMETVLQQSF